MAETSNKKQVESTSATRIKPKRESELRHTFAASRNNQAGGAWDDDKIPNSNVLQRQCDCGNHTIGGTVCRACGQDNGPGQKNRIARQYERDSTGDDTPVEAQILPDKHLARDLSQIPTHTLATISRQIDRHRSNASQPNQLINRGAEALSRVIALRRQVEKGQGITAVGSRASTDQQIQRVIDPISAVGLGVAVFGLVAGLLPYGTSGLKWKRNIGKAVHNWPADRRPGIEHWVRDNDEPIFWASCISGLSSAWSFWDIRWNYNGADVDQAHVRKRRSSSWHGGTGSSIDITFEMQDASASYETGGKAAMICYISGLLDPVGAGDIDFAGRVLIFADGTTRKLGGLEITRGDSSDFTITNYGVGWKIAKN